MLSGLLTQLMDGAEAALASTARHAGGAAPPPVQIAFLPGPFRGRLVVCGFPSANVRGARADRSLAPLKDPAELALWIKSRFPPAPKFVVWNLAGVAYDTAPLDGNVVEYDFPGRPIPPLQVLVEIAVAVHAWLVKDETNVAVVHDLSGRRAAIVAACALELARPINAESALHALVVPALGAVGRALVPSQHRYYDYFCSLRRADVSTEPPPPNASADETRMKPVESPAFTVLRVIVNGVPVYESGGCRPVLHVLDRDGNVSGEAEGPALVPGWEGSFSLSFLSKDPAATPRKPTVIQGDVMLRLFHEIDNGPNGHKLAPVFAVAFHTGFVKRDQLVMRFSANDVDGAATNARVPPDLFLDVILAEGVVASVPPEPSRTTTTTTTTTSTTTPTPTLAKTPPPPPPPTTTTTPSSALATSTLEEIDALLAGSAADELDMDVDVDMNDEVEADVDIASP